MRTQDLNRISNLGFTITINWNQDITILFEDLESYTLDGDLVVLVYTYSPISDFNFEDVFDLVVDEFNCWYSENIDLVQKYFETKDSGIKSKIPIWGNITQKINRQFKINGLLNEDYDF